MRVVFSTHVQETTETKDTGLQPHCQETLKNTLLPLLFPRNIRAHLSICFSKEIIKDTDFLRNGKIDLSLSKHILKLSCDETTPILCFLHQTNIISLDDVKGGDWFTSLQRKILQEAFASLLHY